LNSFDLVPSLYIDKICIIRDLSKCDLQIFIITLSHKFDVVLDMYT